MFRGEILVRHADNFLIVSEGPMPTDQTLLSSPYVRFDLRTRTLTRNLNLNNMDWYYNYIESMRHLVLKYPDGYATYLLDAGYVPVIYLPIDSVDTVDRGAICNQYYTELNKALMKSGIPYTSMVATTFMPFRISYNNVTDVWVSKMDAAKFLNKAPETITADDVIEEVLKYV